MKTPPLKMRKAALMRLLIRAAKPHRYRCSDAQIVPAVRFVSKTGPEGRPIGASETARAEGVQAWQVKRASARLTAFLAIC